MTDQTVRVLPAHDPATWRNLPAGSTPLDPDRVAALLAAEWERFAAATAGSAAHHERAMIPLPLGVSSSFQHWDPHPIAMSSAQGAWLRDVDGRELFCPPTPSVSGSRVLSPGRPPRCATTATTSGPISQPPS